MAVTQWLIDKSAFVRLQSGRTPDGEEWASRAQRGLIRISTVTRLELGTSVRSGDEGRLAYDEPPLSLMPMEYLTPGIENRAWEVQMLLADRGQHRAPSVADLLIAATAEVNHLVVLAIDKDFDLISQVTGQPVERLREA